MVGYATVDIDKLNNWIEAEKEKINNHTADCWYDSLWENYFYHRQNLFKNANPIIKSQYSYYDQKYEPISESAEFINLITSLNAEGQRLVVVYADDTAVMTGYQVHKYILPADLVEIEYLKDYAGLTLGQLSALGDKQMNDAMLPTDMEGYSLNSLEDALNSKKKEISDAEEKCKQAIEEIRQEALKKEQELKELLAKETEKLRVMKEDLENKIFVLDTQIYGIRCYLGEVIDFTQIRTGKAAASDVPVVIFQKIRFLDEEMGKYLSLYTFGQYKDDNETLIGALKARDDLRDVFCPADRCITVFRNSRNGKAVKSSDYAANMLEQYEYLHGKQIAILVRDGDNLFIGWTDEDKISLLSEDVFLRPGEVTVNEVEDTEYGFGHKYWSETDRIKAEKRYEKLAAEERISRYFLISIIQGMIDRGGLINIPKKTRITEESDLVKFSFAEGWLKDNSYGTFKDILDRSKDIVPKVGETVLTGMRVTRDDVHDYSSRSSSEYAAYCNDRGIGYKNRTHGASVQGFTFIPFNKILKEATVEVTFDLVKGVAVENPEYYFKKDHAKAYDVVKDPSGEVLGTYTRKMHLDPNDFNKANSSDYVKVVTTRFGRKGCCPLWRVKETDDKETSIDFTYVSATRYEWLPDLSKYGIPEIKSVKVLDEDYHTYVSVSPEYGSRHVNFEIMPDEYVRVSYLCSTWLKYAITTGNIGDFCIGGTRMSYAEALKYLNKLVERVRDREETEKILLIEAGGKEYVESHPDWDRELCEWRIANQIPILTARHATKFIK